MRKFRNILLLSVITLTLSGCAIGKKYMVDLEEIKYINKVSIDTMALENNVTTIFDEKVISELYGIFANKETSKESTSDNPNNADKLYFLTFYTTDEDSSSIYIYSKDNKYFIEQPYNGIYKSTKEEFDIVEKYLEKSHNYNIGAESKIKIADNTLNMEIKKVSSTKATITLKNNTKETYEYGNPFTLETKKDGKWYNLNPENEMNFTLPAFELKPKKSVNLEIDWEHGYGSLAKGTYRIVKDISKKIDNTDNYENYIIAVEFEIV